MTVGAVNKNEQFVGYSSQGPGALHSDKPDFCSITHFTGYNTSDSGTSAATPIAAGVCALLKDAKASLTPEQIKDCLMDTAKNIGAPGFDRHSGAGIIQAWAAYSHCGKPNIRTIPGIDTNPRLDRITDPNRDRITSVLRDTSTQRDRLTITYRDRITRWPRDTSPRVDNLTSVTRDQIGTSPRIDVVKQPYLDTRDERIRKPQDPIIRRPRRLERPLVLSTPHHAEEWEEFDDGNNSQDINPLEQQIQEAQAYLNELLQIYQQYNDDLDSDEDCDCYDDPDDDYEFDL